MQRLLLWLSDEVSERRALLKIIIFVTPALVFHVLVAPFIVLDSGYQPLDFSFLENFGPITLLWLPFGLAIGLFFLAFIEELLFRFVPLGLAVKFFGRSPLVILTAILFSVLFGLCHGGFRHIFLQGVTGFVLSIVFLKCGGFQKKLLRATFVCAIIHASLNFLACLICVADYFIRQGRGL